MFLFWGDFTPGFKDYKISNANKTKADRKSQILLYQMMQLILVWMQKIPHNIQIKKGSFRQILSMICIVNLTSREPQPKMSSPHAPKQAWPKHRLAGRLLVLRVSLYHRVHYDYTTWRKTSTTTTKCMGVAQHPPLALT